MIGEGRLRINGRWENILEISNLGVLLRTHSISTPTREEDLIGRGVI